MILDAGEYIDEMARRGRLSAAAPIAERNDAVWRAYLRRYDALVGPAGALRVLLTPSGLGLYQDPLNETGAWEWALLGPISHPILPWSVDEVLRGIEALPAEFEAAGLGPPRVRTDTFGFSAPPDAEQARRFLWLNSPRARFFGDFERYLASLTHDRRKELRAQIRRFDGLTSLRFSLSAQPPNTTETDFVLTKTVERWGADAPYALAQWAWPMAIAEALPEKVLFMRVLWQGELVLLAAYVLRDEVAICQATCRAPTDALPGLGGFVDGELIRRLCAAPGPVQVMDPTCRTGVEDTPAIWVSKRRLVNEDQAWPALIVDASPPPLAELDGVVPHFNPGRGWVLPAVPARIGRPA